MSHRSILLLLLSLTVGCRKPDPRKLILIIVPSQDNPFFKAEADAAALRAEQLGYRSRVDSHDDNAYRQDNLIDVAIASNSVAIILDNAGSDSSVSAVRRATKAGIPVFLIDREIATDGIAKAQIIADNGQGAQVVAAQFVAVLGATGEYVELLGRESDTNAQIRTSGFHQILDKAPKLKLVSAQSANWSQSEAFSKTETMLQAHSGIRGIIAANDTMALGAAAAVRSAGLKNIHITGFDGSPDAVAAIQAGAIDATALQPAVVISRMAVDEADHFLRAGSTGQPERQVIRCNLVTRENANDFINFEKVR